ncbi:MAG TPA: hypothetical protein DEF18_03030 [Muricauda sp.]|nr:hypothetical protein [Allomuricauda sp.]MBC70720.1 hypothetical protein [Allomuricauda sp.]HBU77052.1 hypothetical protein [Allomuricauda sp.]
MAPLFRFKTYLLVFMFYKTILLASTLITVLLMFFKAPFSSIIALKLVFIGLFILRFSNPGYSKDLVLYQNFGISKFCLLSLAFVFDLLISIIIYIIFFH